MKYANTSEKFGRKVKRAMVNEIFNFQMSSKK
jgi:hypothetical protein